MGARASRASAQRQILKYALLRARANMETEGAGAPAPSDSNVVQCRVAREAPAGRRERRLFPWLRGSRAAAPEQSG